MRFDKEFTVKGETFFACVPGNTNNGRPIGSLGVLDERYKLVCAVVASAWQFHPISLLRCAQRGDGGIDVDGVFTYFIDGEVVDLWAFGFGDGIIGRDLFVALTWAFAKEIVSVLGQENFHWIETLEPDIKQRLLVN